MGKSRNIDAKTLAMLLDENLEFRPTKRDRRNQNKRERAELKRELKGFV